MWTNIGDEENALFGSFSVWARAASIGLSPPSSRSFSSLSLPSSVFSTLKLVFFNHLLAFFPPKYQDCDEEDFGEINESDYEGGVRN